MEGYHASSMTDVCSLQQTRESVYEIDYLFVIRSSSILFCMPRKTKGTEVLQSNVQRNLNSNENLISFEIILWLTHLDIPTSFYYLMVHCGGLVVVRVNPLISWPGTAGQRNPTSIDLASRHPSDPSGTSFQRVACNHLVRGRGFWTNLDTSKIPKTPVSSFKSSRLLKTKGYAYNVY